MNTKQELSVKEVLSDHNKVRMADRLEALETLYLIAMRDESKDLFKNQDALLYAKQLREIVESGDCSRKLPNAQTPGKTIAPQVSALDCMYAVLKCPHTITADRIVLLRDDDQPGNALHQMVVRLAHALESGAAK